MQKPRDRECVSTSDGPGHGKPDKEAYVDEVNRVIRRRRWTAAEDGLIREQYDSKTAGEIAALINRTEDAVWLRASRVLGLEKREEQQPWTEADLEEVRHCYPVERPAAIAERLSRTVSSISQKAAILGVISRDTVIGQSAVHDYFSVVDTPEKAYVLGLLAADGCVAGKHPRVVFGLQAKDAHLVEFVRDCLNPEASVWRAQDNGFARIQITSSQMVADLARFGVVPRKSLILQWPALPEAVQRSFLLGYFDGDGTMYVVRDRYPGWSVCSGSEQFLIEMKEYIRVSTGVALEKIHHRPKTDLYQVATTGRGAWIVNEWLHQDDGLGLARKRHPERVLSQYRLLV
jgi:hypothetical protein